MSMRSQWAANGRSAVCSAAVSSFHKGWLLTLGSVLAAGAALGLAAATAGLAAGAGEGAAVCAAKDTLAAILAKPISRLKPRML
jgi:hypothetical protein